jgi:DNA-binding CsgD family transcriptional regulator
MQHTPGQLQLLTRARALWSDPEWLAQGLERLTLLVPELAHGAMPDLPSCALAYVARYGHDVPQLQHEWELLYAALTLAWQRAEYAVVVQLADALAHLADRLQESTVGEHILHLGIAASRRVQDRQHLIRFLNRLGGLLFAHGQYRQGQRLWYTSLELAGPDGCAQGLWEPFSSFAHIADMLGCSARLQPFVEMLLRSSHSDSSDSPDSLAVAIFIRGFYSHLGNKLEAAYQDLSSCLQLLSHQPPGATPSCYRQLFSMVVQAELARVQGDYARSQAYTETALALAQLFGDRHTLVDLLFDQAHFTFYHKQFADTQATILRLCEVARQAPYLYERYHLLERHLAALLPAPSTRPTHDQPIPSTAVQALQEPLSERECEVLQLVAEGHANREIAARLMITPGTVKKHLEHIYGKLDAHNRTSAVARARALKIIP